MRTDLADIERVASETADSMRDMVHLISPRRTDEGNDWLGVLRALIERLLRGTSLDLALPAAPLPFEPDLETRRELYLFCKEVLHNISRHANATRVRFHLSPTPKGLRIEIADNGIGFDSAAPSFGHGLGNLRERAAVIKANLQITSRIGIGTSITLDLPRNHRWRKPET
jgi:signal transduction histidine kinase